MRRRLLLLVPLLVAAVLIGAFWGLGRAFAQTPTFTPWPTVEPTYTPAGTPSPTPTPPSFGSTVVWGCWLANENAAPVCTWGDYFDIRITLHKAYGDGQPSPMSAPGDGVGGTSTTPGKYALLPPVNTKRIEATCSEYVYGANADFGTGSSSGRASRSLFSYSPYIEMVRTDGFSNPRVEDCSATSSGDVTCVTSQAISTYTVTWTLSDSYASWPLADSFPTWSTRSSYVGFGGYVWVAATGAACPNIACNNYGRASVRIACQIDRVVRLDGSMYTPTNPSVGDVPTPVPTVTVPFTWTDFVWVDYPDYEIAPPQNSDFEFAPGDTTCPATIPAFGFEWVDMPFVGTVSFGWDEQEFCFQDYSIESELLNVDVDNMIGTFISLIFVVFMINNWRTQS